MNLTPRLLLALLLALPCVPAIAEDEEENYYEDNISDAEYLKRIGEKDEVDKAVDKAIKYLIANQDSVSGQFGKDQYRNVNTALATIALMASGHFPGRSEYGENLRRGVMFLAREAKNTKNKGYLGNDGGRMYGHGICTLALTEAYGMLQDIKENDEIKEAIDEAVNVILNAQVKQNGSHHGGWRYSPKGNDADLSVAVWQLLVLRSAKNCLLDVPQKSIDDGIAYVRRTYRQHPDKRHQGFSYQPGHNPTPAMRCAGIVCMLALGANKEKKDENMITTSASILMDKNFKPDQGNHFYYTSYYIATAANMLRKEYRKKILPLMERTLIQHQRPNGEFAKHRGHDGGVYATAFATISLCVRYQYLPIYQE